MSFEFGMVWFTAVILCALALVPIIYLIRSRPHDLSAQQAARYERVVKLPFGTGENYLRQPWRRVLAPIALGTASVGVAAVLAWRLVQPSRIATETVLWCAGLLVFAIIVFVVMRVMERIVLSQPQVASDDLQLAWDDLFRADALWSLRSAATMAAALPLGIAAGTLTLTPIAATRPELSTLMSPWTPVLIAAAQVTYSLRLGKMAASRYPAALRPQSRRFASTSVELARGEGA